MKIRKFKKEDVKEVSLLIMNTYKKFNKDEFFNKDSFDDYVNRNNPKLHSEEELFKGFSRTPIIYVAEDKGIILGAIRGTQKRIVNLFVLGKHHKKGIGRKLVEKFEQIAIKEGSKKIKIRSSLYAAPFYQKMGYKKTTGVRNFRGLKIIPMEKILN